MQREWRRLTSGWFYPLAMVIIPLAAGVLINATFAPAVLHDIPVAVCDEDHSPLSRNITRLLDATPELAVVRQVDDLAAGRNLIVNGKCQALIHFPKGLARDLTRKTPQPVVAYVNNIFLQPAGSMDRAIKAALTTASVSQAAGVRMSMGAMEPAATSEALPIRLENHVLYNPYLNYSYFLTATLLPALLGILVICLTIFAFGSELRYGTADDWLASADRHPWAAVIGKALTLLIVFAGLSLIMLTWLIKGVGLPMEGSWARLWTVTILFIAANQASALLFLALTSNLRLALSIGGAYAVTAYPFAGITFPMIGMPTAARYWSESLPLTHYLRLLLGETLRPGVPDMWAWTVLAGFTLVVGSLAMIRLPRLMRDQSYWGRI
jgi:ABC-2 type transport system permease protein